MVRRELIFRMNLRPPSLAYGVILLGLRNPLRDNADFFYFTLVVSALTSYKADNTDTGYRFEVICRFPYRIKDFGSGEAESSWLFARLRAYSSNALICSSITVRIGSIVTGVVTACYSGNSRAYLDSWSVVTDVLSPPTGFHPTPTFPPFSWGGTGGFEEWKNFAPQTFLKPADFVVCDQVIDWLPTVGGRPYAVDEPVENRINGCRIKPPNEDQRIFIRMRRAEMNANPDHTAPARRVAFTDTTYVRPRRGRSSSRPRP